MDQQTPGDVGAAVAAPPLASETTTAGGRAMAGGAKRKARVAITRVGFADIWRVNAERREIELCATSEAQDSYGTVFSYEASKHAFGRWEGNVREMHDPHKAVGQKLDVTYDDVGRKIFVRVCISLGAEDTWQKVLDGTLRGASIGASNVVWQKRLWRREGESRPLDVAVSYDLVELSLVDNPSNPDALGVTIVRDAVPDAAVLASLGSYEREAAESEGGEESAPASQADEGGHPSALAVSISGNSGSAEATLRIPASLHGRPGKDAVRPPHKGLLAEIGIAQEDAPSVATRDRGPFSTNAEGYPDVGVPPRSEEPPTSALGMTPDGNARGRFHDALLGIARGCGCALCEMATALYDEAEEDGTATARAQQVRWRDASVVRALAVGMQASSARLDAVQIGIRDVQALVREAGQRATGTNAELQRRLEALEAQPMPGGPAARPVEKSLALATERVRESAGSNPAEAIRALQGLAGRLTDPQAQIAVAAELIRLQQER